MLSARTPVVTAASGGAPAVLVRPTVSGTTLSGSVLTADGGTWQGVEPMRVEFRWRRCAADGGACEDLRRAGKAYQLSARDVGHALRALVLVANRVGASAALSDATNVVGPVEPKPDTAPKNISPPLISGTAAQGKTLTASSGSWSSPTPLSFSFQWRRCDGRADGRCSPIRDAIEQIYVLREADVGHTIQVAVTGRNSDGRARTLSARTPVVADLNAPVNSAPPRIGGDARDGSVLTVSSGSWTGTAPIAFAYQWLECDAAGNRCRPIRAQTAASYTLTSADVGHALRVRVTATNAGGASSVISGPSAAIAGRGVAPANVAAPFLSGTAEQGARLSVSSGRWTGTQPIGYSYRWMRCNASVGECGAIAGATGSSYVLTRADVGHRLYGVVTARNSVGSASASSNATPAVVGAPINDALPTISGSLVEGAVLTATPGSWTGPGPITYGYQWTRCDASGEFSSCTPIVVTSQPTYTLRLADVGHRIFVQVKALNSFGASYVNSHQTDVVAPAPVGTVTVRSMRGTVVFGRPVALTGRAVGAPAGAAVTIIEQPVRGLARVRQNATVTTTAGTWTYVARPTIRTSYRVQVRGRTSTVVSVFVRPRLQLRRVGPGRVSIRVYAARSFARRAASLQRWNAARHRWVTVRTFRLTSTRIGTPTAVSAATIRTRTRRGTLVRVVLPSRQAGIGYTTGISNRVRS